MGNLRKIKFCLQIIFLVFFFAQICKAQEAKIITDIQVKGNRTVSSSTIFSKIKSKVNQPYFQNVVSDDLKRLYATGFFKDINIDVEDYLDGVRVIFEVVERPILEKIVITGNNTIAEQRLTKDFKSKIGQYLDYTLLQDDLDQIKRLYFNRGFSKVEVNYKETVDKDNNRATIYIRIKENQRIRVRILNITGNYSFSDSRILKLIKTRKKSFFKSGFFNETVFQEDIEKIKAFYNRQGFANCKVDPEIEYGPFDSIYITINISEGNKYYIGDVIIKGNKNIQTFQILQAITYSKKGEIFNREDLEKDAVAIQEVYFNKGYIFARVLTDTFVNPETGNIAITFSIIEDEIAYVNLIKIKGNIKTKDVVIRRELRINPGERFDGVKLKRSRERLNNLGFFEEVNFDLQDTKQPNKKDLVVEVKESKTGEFSFGGGYSSINEFVGFVEVTQKNFDWKNWPYFTGAGQTLRLRAEFGTVSDEYDLSFTEPWFLERPLSFGFDLYRISHQRESDIGYAFDEKRTGGDIRFGKEFGEYLSGNIAYRVENIDIGNVVEEATQDLKREVGLSRINGIELNLTYDSRDNIFSPTKGNVISGFIEAAGGPLSGDKDFVKSIAKFSHYLGFIKKSTFRINMLAGIATAYDDTENVPIYRRFYAGGANTIRGYEERKVGPIDEVTKDPIGGNSMFIANFEYLYPIMDIIKLVAFFDSGNVWSKSSDLIKSGDFKSSIGLGLRLKTPIGPIKLDYGIPLDTAPGEEDKKSGRFHFSVGRSF